MRRSLHTVLFVSSAVKGVVKKILQGRLSLACMWFCNLLCASMDGSVPPLCKVNVTYAAPSDTNKQLPEGTQPMIASYQVTGVAEFAKKMEDEGERMLRWKGSDRPQAQEREGIGYRAMF